MKKIIFAVMFPVVICLAVGSLYSADTLSPDLLSQSKTKSNIDFSRPGHTIFIKEQLREYIFYIAKNIRAFVFDLQGTLTDSEGTASDKIIYQLIEILKMDMIDIFLATGNRFASTSEFSDLIVYSDLIKEQQREEVLKRLHLYIANGAIGYDILDNVGEIRTAYFRKEFDINTVVAMKEFFKGKGWFSDSRLKIYAPETDCFKINIKAKDKKDRAILLPLIYEIIFEFLQHALLDVDVSFGGGAVEMNPKGVNKGFILEDIKQRFQLEDFQMVKMGDKAQKQGILRGNDFLLLRGENSFTVEDGDDSNPEQINAARILSVTNNQATEILLDMFIEAFKTLYPVLNQSRKMQTIKAGRMAV